MSLDLAILSDAMRAAVVAIDRLVAGRRDGYIAWDPDSPKSSNYTAKKPLTLDTWVAHLTGQRGVGVFPVVSDMVGWFAYDIDFADDPTHALSVCKDICSAARTAGFTAYPEKSGSKGYHVWVFLSAPVAAWKARAVGRKLLTDAGHHEIKPAAGRELAVYPLEDSIIESGWGHALKAPCFGRPGVRKLLDEAFLEVPDQLAAIAAASQSDVRLVLELVDRAALMPSNMARVGDATVPTAIAPDPRAEVMPRADAGALDDLTDAELEVLSSRLPALRRAVNAARTCGYNHWLAALIHLVPFRNGMDQAHRISLIDEARYDASEVDRKWAQALALYARGMEASISERIVRHARTGGREDVVPLSARYCIWRGGFATRKWAKEGPLWTEKEPTPLSNFVARIDHEEVAVDGDDTSSKTLYMSGTMGHLPLESLEIPGRVWSKPNEWVPAGWGGQPHLFSGSGASWPQFLEATSLASAGCPQIKAYCHTGWTKIDGRWLYFLPSGPIGGDLGPGARLDIPPELARYQVTITTNRDVATQSFQLLESLIRAGDITATAPLIAAMFLAPLTTMLNIDFFVHLAGVTGTRKSTLAAMALSLYGPFSRSTPPLTFLSSAKYILDVAHAAKDLPVVVDNLVSEVHGASGAETLARIAHAVGDCAPAGKLRRDSVRMVAKKPRGLIVTTGESVEAQGSALARMYLIPTDLTSVDKAKSEPIRWACADGALSIAGGWYLAWLTAQMTDAAFLKRLHARWVYHSRTHSLMNTVHGRTIEQLAWMKVGVELMAECHPSQWDSPNIPAECSGALDEIAIHQVAEQKQVTSTIRFLGALFAAFACGRFAATSIKTRAAPERFAPLLGWAMDPHTDYLSLIRHDATVGLAVYIDKDSGAGSCRDWAIGLQIDAVMQVIDPKREMGSPWTLARALKQEGLSTGRETRYVSGVGSKSFTLLDGVRVLAAIGICPFDPNKENQPWTTATSPYSDDSPETQN